MTETKPDEVQQELFGEFGASASKPKQRFPALHKTQKPILISTGVEQIILFSIVGILTACGVFFLGILRGKSMTNAPRAAMDTLTPRQVSAPVAMRGVTKENVRPAAKVSPVPKVLLPDPGKPYTIQLVTFKKEDQAEREVAKIRAQGIYAFIIPSGDYYQVCAGQYASKEDAARNLKSFSVKFRDCFIRRR